jgi:phosphatidylglycerol:prolipoprotein diacylglycerol transferase
VLFVNPAYYFQNPLQIFAVWEGGMYFFGGFIMAVILPYFYIRKQDLNYFDLADFIIIPAPIGPGVRPARQLYQRRILGPAKCVSPCHGIRFGPAFKLAPGLRPAGPGNHRETGMTVLAGQSMVNLPRHPVQLYELVLNGIVLYAILLLFRNIGRAKPRGSVASLFLLGYGVFRFWVEFYREPVSHSAIIAGDWFTLSMLFAIPMIVLGAVGLIISYRKNQENLLYRAVI